MSIYIHDDHPAVPRPGTLADADERPVPRGMEGHRYPVTGQCATCGDAIRCADGTADWGHVLQAYEPAVGDFVRVVRWEQPSLAEGDRDRKLSAVHLGEVTALLANHVIELRVADSPDGPGLVRIGLGYVFLGLGSKDDQGRYWYLVTRVSRVDPVLVVSELTARVAELERLAALLSEYGQAMVGDQWWPGNASVYLAGEPGRELERLLS
jgi:hypothetical protein